MSGSRPRSGGAGRPAIEAVLLAAGLSRRMGAANKLLLEIDGVPMVRRAAEALLGAGLKLTVVVGHERALIETALAGLSAHIVFNPDYKDGQPSSVRAGLAALGIGHGAVLIGLGDQPLLEASDIGDLIAAFGHSQKDKILIPEFAGERGNPIIVPAEIVNDIGTGPVNLACRKFIDNNPARVLRFEANNDHFTRDIDTADAFDALKGRDTARRSRRETQTVEEI